MSYQSDAGSLVYLWYCETYMTFVGWNFRKIITETYLSDDILGEVLDPRGLTTEVFIESTTDYNIVYPPRNGDRNLSPFIYWQRCILFCIFHTMTAIQFHIGLKYYHFISTYVYYSSRFVLFSLFTFLYRSRPFRSWAYIIVDYACTPILVYSCHTQTQSHIYIHIIYSYKYSNGNILATVHIYTYI